MDSSPAAASPGGAPPPVPAAPPAPPAFDRRRVYAEWFAWARTLVADEARCHAAAAAAVHALAAGQSPALVTELATRIAQGGHSIAPDLLGGDRIYAGWFAWANLQHRLDPERSHLAAAAATQAQVQGLSPAAAADIALQAAGVAGGHAAAAHSRTLNNGALWNVGWGVLSTVLALLSPIYLPIAPLIGLAWGWRVLQQSRQPLVFVALAVNGVALVVNALRFFRVF